MKTILIIFLLLGLVYGGQNLKEVVLENGVKLILKETKGRGIIAGSIFIKGGTHGEGKRGTTNLMAVLLTKGTKTYSSYEIASAFEDWGGFISSSAADDYVEISFATRPQGLDQALKVIESILLEPSFKEENLQVEKRRALSRIRSRREDGFELAMEKLRLITYKGTTYEVSPLGTEEDLQKIGREDLLKRWEELLKGKNVVVAVVGDVDLVEMERKFSEVFSRLPSGEFSFSTQELLVEDSLIQKVQRDGSQATVLCAFQGVPPKGKDFFAFRVLNSILGDGMTSKLFDELREKRGYAYATYSMSPIRLYSPRLFAYIGTSPEKKESAIKDLIWVVQDANITEEDIALAKRKIIGGYLLDRQTRGRQAFYLGFWEIVGFGYKMEQDYVKHIEEVSLQDVLKVRDALKKGYHCVVVEP
ncbi:M16 family metallopeptidase [Thermocrinis jamiesonii]|uniref:M16 family metallopeptidase n=1 Tax=Thermocrinis jamiesonii TaxID=1302351 RepID=UPI0004976992|nr:pitrilysin family protein [Thermocrinis jamiesonii]